MFDTLFGAEVSPALKFFLAFVIVLVLIGVTAWLVRRFGAERFGGSSGRGRQPRLALVDKTEIDQRRSLVIVRRDNVEHLLMIGGPTDVVIEQNIVRATGAPRDKSDPALGRGISAAETLSRPVPLGEGTMWPLQPQPESNGRAPRSAPEEPAQWTWPAHPEPQRASRSEPRLDKQGAQAKSTDEISARPNPARESAGARQVTPPVSRATPVVTPPAAEKVARTDRIAAAADTDQNLADMANRLEPALRRPNEPRAISETSMSMKIEAAPPPPMTRVTPEARMSPPESPIALPEQKPAPADTKSKGVFDSLEEEMASLLGRPPGKT
jgi:hypothetical protein